MSMDFKTFRSIAPAVAQNGLSVMMRGRHGIGKSQVVYQIAEDLKLPVIERRAAQMTEGDLIGLPRQNSEVTEFMPPDWLKAACDAPVLLFVDEIDRAVREVQQGFFELCDSRKIYGNYLHKDTVVFAAVNSGEHAGAADYQTVEMGPAFLDRWFVADIEPSTEDWLNWGKDRIDQLVWDFINQNHNFLEHVGIHEPNKVYPSRRSWDRLNSVLSGMEAFKLEDPTTEVSGFFHIVNGFVGFEGGVAFMDFIKNYERQVTVEDILVHGKIKKTANFGVPEHTALIEKMNSSGAFTEKLETKQIKNLAKYFFTLPSEPIMKLYAMLGSDGNNGDNLVAFHGTKIGKNSVSDRLVEVITGEQNKKAENDS